MGEKTEHLYDVGLSFCQCARSYHRVTTGMLQISDTLPNQLVSTDKQQQSARHTFQRFSLLAKKLTRSGRILLRRP